MRHGLRRLFQDFFRRLFFAKASGVLLREHALREKRQTLGEVGWGELRSVDENFFCSAVLASHGLGMGAMIDLHTPPRKKWRSSKQWDAQPLRAVVHRTSAAQKFCPFLARVLFDFALPGIASFGEHS